MYVSKERDEKTERREEKKRRGEIKEKPREKQKIIEYVAALASLIASGELAGYQSGKKQYTPLVFEHARTNYIVSFFNSNSFIGMYIFTQKFEFN